MKINWDAIIVALFFLGAFIFMAYTALTIEHLEGKQSAFILIPAMYLVQFFGKIGGAIVAVLIGILGFCFLMLKTKKEVKKEEQEEADKKTAKRL